MVNHINDQKLVTRQALSYVADVTRNEDGDSAEEVNMRITSTSLQPYQDIAHSVYSPQQQTRGADTVSEGENSQESLEMSQQKSKHLRQEKLMDILRKTEIPKR